MLRDLTISAFESYSRRRDFNFGTNCVSSMFIHFLGEYNAGPFLKVIVEASEASESHVEEMDNVVRISRQFVFRDYWTSPDPKQVLAEFLYDGLHELAERYDWASSPLRDSMLRMKERSYSHVVDWKRPISSPNRRRSAQVRYYYGQKAVQIVAVIRTKGSSEFREVELARTAPHELKFVPLLGRLRWRGDDLVVLEPRRKNAEPIVRSI